MQRAAHANKETQRLPQTAISRFFLIHPRQSEKGSVFLYIFAAIALLAALTYAFVKDNNTSMSAQEAGKAGQNLNMQLHLIRSAVVECALTYPNGGGDLDGSGVIDDSDNPNNPYPVKPTHPNNPAGVAVNDNVRNLSCTGAPVGYRNMFTGSNNNGRFLPQPANGFSEWVYLNDADGVRIKTTAPNTASAISALNHVVSSFNDACEATLNYGGCGANCLTVWIHHKTACP